MIDSWLFGGLSIWRIGPDIAIGAVWFMREYAISFLGEVGLANGQVRHYK